MVSEKKFDRLAQTLDEARRHSDRIGARMLSLILLMARLELDQFEVNQPKHFGNKSSGELERFDGKGRRKSSKRNS